ncbi:sensor histidine kinase [Hymenobacter profundi]|uniref:histidine kinase n=1 Tax=Hymenobacter profundi TaxID=1982110 RepID=A0ABS6X0M3_9BACT|nr:HAMP domain-containing sensor histidine kinase [Hymenobacter profundi]MBW3129032.1 HAMP domain-containing histidine kinase [Hymenobacter profundi]
MNKRIWLATGLMLLGTLGVLIFQAYWTYQTFQQAERRLIQDAQAALVATRDQALALQRQQLLRQYRGWLRDTSHVRISCFVNHDSLTEFRLTAYHHGRPARPKDQFDIGFEDFKPRLAHITPAAQAFFIRRFTEGPVRRNLEEGFYYFYLQWLGRQLDTAVRRSTTTPATFQRLFAAELRRRGLHEVAFQVQLRSSVHAAPMPPAPTAFPVALPPQPLGLRQPAQQTVRVWLPATSAVVLRQLRGVLWASGLLMGLVLGCFGYTVSTMRRQKRLADLKDDFTHNMTHELKTPVATIQLAADSLQYFQLDTVTSAEYTALISEQAGRLNGLIEQILRSMALEQHALPLARQPLDWVQLITTTLTQHAPHFAQTDRHVCWEPPAIPAMVCGDATHLANVLSTLLDNARKYGGPHLRLHLETAPTGISLHVHDDGPGIPATFQAHVFDKFFRVPSGNVHAVKGYGLGLHYARQVAEQHGGSLQLHSKTGQGTTFLLTLPLA